MSSAKTPFHAGIVAMASGTGAPPASQLLAAVLADRIGGRMRTANFDFGPVMVIKLNQVVF